VPDSGPRRWRDFCIVVAGTELLARAMLTLGFDKRPHFAAVSEFVKARSVENNFLTFAPDPDTPTDFRDLGRKCLTL